jgi:hypothetical protein
MSRKTAAGSGVEAIFHMEYLIWNMKYNRQSHRNNFARLFKTGHEYATFYRGPRPPPPPKPPPKPGGR